MFVESHFLYTMVLNVIFIARNTFVPLLNPTLESFVSYRMFMEKAPLIM